MPKPIAVCIEDFSPDLETSRFVSCVALPGGQPGLRLDAGGAVLWKSDDAVSCELWVSADDCLILYRPEGAPVVILHRAGRSLDVPFGKPVVVVDQDEIDVGGRKLRLHVHGEATDVSAPSEVVPKQSGLNRLKRAAAAVVLGSAIATGSLIEVRCTPPVIVQPEDKPGETEPTEEGSDQDQQSKTPGNKQNEGKSAQDQQPEKPPIEVRDHPPRKK